MSATSRSTLSSGYRALLAHALFLALQRTATSVEWIYVVCHHQLLSSYLHHKTAPRSQLLKPLFSKKKSSGICRFFCGQMETVCYRPFLCQMLNEHVSFPLCQVVLSFAEVLSPFMLSLLSAWWHWAGKYADGWPKIAVGRKRLQVLSRHTNSKYCIPHHIFDAQLLSHAQWRIKRRWDWFLQSCETGVFRVMIASEPVSGEYSNKTFRFKRQYKLMDIHGLELFIITPRPTITFCFLGFSQAIIAAQTPVLPE